jgi:DNA invertase Pin-like site-specific DNA recombinase
MTEILHIYTRVSTISQEEEGTSLETQLETGIQRSEKLGMDYKIWNEGGQSSSKDDLANRPRLTELLQEMDEGNVNHLYVWNTDRLSRNLNTWGMIRFKLIKNDVTLHTPTGKQILSDPQTNMMLGILSEISQYDNQLRTERFRLGKLKRIKQGGWMGGPPPYGYKLEERRIVPDDYEKEWVKFIFEKYRDGCSIDEIRNELRQNGVPTRRGNAVWSHGSLDKLLTNTHYGGYYNFTDKKSEETVRSSCSPILLPSLIQAVHELKVNRAYGRLGSKRIKTSTQKYTYLLKDLLVCGHCGARYGGNYKQKQTSYYSCNQKTNKFKTTYTDRHVECGSNRNIRIDKTDELVWNTVSDVLSASRTFKEQLKIKTVRDVKEECSSEADIKNIKRKLKKINVDIIETTNTIVNFETSKLVGKGDQSRVEKVIINLEKHLLDLEAEKEKLTNKLLQENKKDFVVAVLVELGKKYKILNNLKQSNLTIEEKKNLLDSVIDKIIVTNTNTKEHELRIEFRLPYVGDKNLMDEKTHEISIKDGRKFKKIRGNLLKKLVV